MSTQGGNPSKTPRQVQIYYFEKKKPAAPPRDTLDNADAEKTLPGVPFTEEVPAHLADTDPGLETTAPSAKPPAPAPRGHKPPGSRRPRPSLDDTPAYATGDGRSEALEYHRRKLEAWMARPGAHRSLAQTALFGHSLFSRGRLREAQVVFEGLVAREPDQPFVYSMLGSVYLAEEELDKALALFEAALQLDGRDAAALVGRAEVRLRRGESRKAHPDLEKAARVDATGPYGARARALSHMHKLAGKRR